MSCHTCQYLLIYLMSCTSKSWIDKIKMLDYFLGTQMLMLFVRSYFSSSIFIILVNFIIVSSSLKLFYFFHGTYVICISCSMIYQDKRVDMPQVHLFLESMNRSTNPFVRKVFSTFMFDLICLKRFL